jgi:hypothetical protein
MHLQQPALHSAPSPAQANLGLHLLACVDRLIDISARFDAMAIFHTSLHSLMLDISSRSPVATPTYSMMQNMHPGQVHLYTGNGTLIAKHIICPPKHMHKLVVSILPSGLFGRDTLTRPCSTQSPICPPVRAPERKLSSPLTCI